MAVFKDVIMIKDRPWDRAVEVTVIYREDVSVINVQELAERVWRRRRQADHGRRCDGEGPGV
jgi:hypothetical protein